MTNFRPPASSASSTFCFRSCRFPTISCPSTPTTTPPPLSFVRLKPIPPPSLGSRSPARLHHGDGRRVHNIVSGRAARQVGDRPRQALQNRPDRLPAAQPLHQFVPDVPAV